jgi:hypothetical protein
MAKPRGKNQEGAAHQETNDRWLSNRAIMNSCRSRTRRPNRPSENENMLELRRTSRASPNGPDADRSNRFIWGAGDFVILDMLGKSAEESKAMNAELRAWGWRASPRRRSLGIDEAKPKGRGRNTPVPIIADLPPEESASSAIESPPTKPSFVACIRSLSERVIRMGRQVRFLKSARTGRKVRSRYCCSIGLGLDKWLRGLDSEDAGAASASISNAIKRPRRRSSSPVPRRRRASPRRVARSSS